MSNMIVGAFGKLPTQADFLKVNAGEFCRLGMDRWFQQAHEVMEGERGRLPDEPAYFVIAVPETDRVLLGALAPSRDAVGRAFPLIVFRCLERADCAEDFPSLPARYARFLHGAAGIAANAALLNGAAVAGHVQTLSLMCRPDPVAETEAVLASEPFAPLGLALGGLPHGAAYSLRTLVSACDQARSAAASSGGRGPITVSGPAPTEGVRLLWLEMARRRLGWGGQALPSYLWTMHMSTRLLLTLGPASASLLAFLANPQHKSPRFWPLYTEVESALGAAVAALGPDHRQVLESPGGTLADILRVFT